MVRKPDIANLARLQNVVAKARLQFRADDVCLDELIDQLGSIGHRYDERKYPRLGQVNPTPDVPFAPTTLAEAFIWKQGDWLKYTNFAAFHARGGAPRDRTVVHDAFALHLRERRPIFDQHTLRAMWVVGEWQPSESAKIKAYLVGRSGKWKESGSGRTAVACYELFCEKVDELLSRGGTGDKLDSFLMPLGKALRLAAPTYDQFKEDF